MYFVKECYSHEQDIKKSNFASYICPFSEFEELKSRLKDENPKAAHIVWAYRYYNKYFQIVENSSDDGEPKGSSGPPCLDALRGANLIDTAVIVVRYFGGVKLGVGGLVRAYGSSANLAINKAQLIKYVSRNIASLFVPFSLLSRFDYYDDKNGLNADKSYSQSGCVYEFNLSLDEFANLHKFVLGYEMAGVEYYAVPLEAKNLFIKSKF
ncbi:YigZ family protein [Campylobacter porcelli]|uniref:YigZ family protein n=1 Tax=Campylobacter porcelli TaxID=1660073 RepID=A0ABU7M657_9BACT|nr:YigZ family protein [Campylobacter sp. CX2-4855-23]